VAFAVFLGVPVSAARAVLPGPAATAATATATATVAATAADATATRTPVIAESTVPVIDGRRQRCGGTRRRRRPQRRATVFQALGRTSRPAAGPGVADGLVGDRGRVHALAATVLRFSNASPVRWWTVARPQPGSVASPAPAAAQAETTTGVRICGRRGPDVWFGRRLRDRN